MSLNSTSTIAVKISQLNFLKIKNKLQSCFTLDWKIPLLFQAGERRCVCRRRPLSLSALSPTNSWLHCIHKFVTFSKRIFLPYFNFFWNSKRKNQRVPNFPWNQRGKSPPFPKWDSDFWFFKILLKMIFSTIYPTLASEFFHSGQFFEFIFVYFTNSHVLFFKKKFCLELRSFLWPIFIFISFIEKMFHAPQKSSSKTRMASQLWSFCCS